MLPAIDLELFRKPDEIQLCGERLKSPHTDVSAYQNAAPCTNGRFDGPHCSIIMG
jgi:hypothetical protein